MRMNRFLAGLCAGAMLVSGVNASRQAEDALRGQVMLRKPIPEGALLPIMARNNVPAVSIAVVRGGEIDWAKGYGVLEAGVSERVDEETLFQATIAAIGAAYGWSV